MSSKELPLKKILCVKNTVVNVKHSCECKTQLRMVSKVQIVQKQRV